MAGFYYARVDERYQGFEGAEQFVEIKPGTGSRAIGRALAEAGVVRDEPTFRMAVYLTGTARELKAGEYRFAGPASPKEIARKLARGAVYTAPGDLSRRADGEGDGARVRVARAWRGAGLRPGGCQIPAALRALDPAARDLEGYLFPETYNLARRRKPGRWSG